ncbi:hypothetical protein SEA_FEYRE_87 [Mycobacterium phage Feyre]
MPLFTVDDRDELALFSVDTAQPTATRDELTLFDLDDVTAA